MVMMGRSKSSPITTTPPTTTVTMPELPEGIFYNAVAPPPDSCHWKCWWNSRRNRCVYHRGRGHGRGTCLE